MTFRHLDAFFEVARCGGFTRAAEALYLTQPTVSGQIKELEQELGVSLFQRLPRSVELTEAGRLLLPRAREIRSARDQFLEQAAAFRGLLWGRLEVVASTIPGEYLLPGILAEFKRNHPGIQIVLRVLGSASVLRGVAAGDLALGVVGEREEGLGLSFVPLWADRVALYGREAHREALDLDRLREVPLVLREEGSGTRRAVTDALADRGVTVEELHVVAEFGSTTAVKEAVRAGIGLGFVSDRAVGGELERGELHPVRVAGLSPLTRSFWAVHDPQRSLSPATQAFLTFLLAEVSREERSRDSVSNPARRGGREGRTP